MRVISGPLALLADGCRAVTQYVASFRPVSGRDEQPLRLHGQSTTAFDPCNTTYIDDGDTRVATLENVSCVGTTMHIGHFAVASECIGQRAGRAAMLSLAHRLSQDWPAIDCIEITMSRQQDRMPPEILSQAREALLVALGVPSTDIAITPNGGIHADQWSVKGRWDKVHWRVALQLPTAMQDYRARSSHINDKNMTEALGPLISTYIRTHKRLLMVTLALVLVVSQASNIEDFFVGFNDGSSGAGS